MSEKKPGALACPLCDRRRSHFGWPEAEVAKAHESEGHWTSKCVLCGVHFTVPRGSDGGPYGALCLSCLTAPELRGAAL